MKKNSVTFSFKPTKSQLESSNFGVQIVYPANKNDSSGYIELQYVRVRVNYTAPKYSVIVDVSNKSPKVGDTIEVITSISNLNMTSYNPNVNISLPSGVSFDSSVDGNFSVSGNNDVVWNPKLSSSMSSLNGVNKFKAYCSTSGAKTIIISLTLNNVTYSSQVTFTVQSPTYSEGSDAQNVDDDDLQTSNDSIIHVEQGERFTINPQFTSEEIANCTGRRGGRSCFVLSVYNNPDFIIDDFTNETELSYSLIYTDLLSEDGSYGQEWYSNTASQKTLIIWSGNVGSSTVLRRIDVEIYPSDLNTPYLSVIGLTDEEYNRLCAGKVYTVQSFIKKMKTEVFNHDWKRNFRVGVFNNEIAGADYTNLTLTDIFENAESWSDCPTNVNKFTSCSCEFTYDDNYPVYIIITGDFFENDPVGNVSFTQPLLFESGSLDELSTQCIFPEPIQNVLSNGNPSELSLPSFTQSNSIVLSDFGIGDEFQTGEKLAIRGVTLSLNASYYDDAILNVKLKSSKGKIGTKSFVLESIDAQEDTENIENNILIGGDFDLWGFKISEMVDLNDFEIELNVDNSYYSEEASDLIFDNIQVIFSYIPVNNDLFQAIINGTEDNRHYGMFITKVEPPFGVNSKVKYYEINGSDFNNAYRMNIDKSEINIDFGVHGCTIEETTALMREIAKLLVNDRDKFNNPIPNRIEFAHLPGQHWDYILEDPIDVDVDTVAYDSSIKLIVPDGTAWANEDTVTNMQGYNGGIAGVNPILEISPLSGYVELSEDETDQHFTLRYDDFSNGDVILIDCVNQKVTLKKWDESSKKYVESDITNTADYNVDWFILPLGEFNFNTHNTCKRCMITFTERR